MLPSQCLSLPGCEMGSRPPQKDGPRREGCPYRLGQHQGFHRGRRRKSHRPPPPGTRSAHLGGGKQENRPVSGPQKSSQDHKIIPCSQGQAGLFSSGCAFPLPPCVLTHLGGCFSSSRSGCCCQGGPHQPPHCSPPPAACREGERTIRERPGVPKPPGLDAYKPQTPSPPSAWGSRPVSGHSSKIKPLPCPGCKPSCSPRRKFRAARKALKSRSMPPAFRQQKCELQNQGVGCKRGVSAYLRSSRMSLFVKCNPNAN